MEGFHKPVLLKEAIEFLNVKPGKKYIDATVGGGGHTAAILRKGGTVLGIDTDPEAVRFAKEFLAAEVSIFNSQFSIVQGNFKDIEKIAKENKFFPVAGVLYDLGLSSYQLEQSGRGFSFQKEEPLDMRADPDLKVTAADLIHGLSENELYKLFKKFGEEQRARAIARVVVQQRAVSPIRTSKELADLITGYSGGRRIHPATRVFQALRIAVNDELNSLESSLPQALELLEPKGRLVVISFHSLEDRIVKRAFSNFLEGIILTKKPVTPTSREVLQNPRARSAKLRAIEKT